MPEYLEVPVHLEDPSAIDFTTAKMSLGLRWAPQSPIDSCKKCWMLLRFLEDQKSLIHHEKILVKPIITGKHSISRADVIQCSHIGDHTTIWKSNKSLEQTPDKTQNNNYGMGH